MLLFLDTNAYIAARYNFTGDYLEKLKELILQGEIQLLYTSITKGEVAEHIRIDVKATVQEYNRAIRKAKLPEATREKYGLVEISEVDAISDVLEAWDMFLGGEGVEAISLNPVDAEALLVDYFDHKPPFEMKKPYEFKDAIVINAIKRYKKSYDETVYVVSADEGFRKAFNEDDGIVTVKYLSNALACYYRRDEVARYAENVVRDGELNFFLRDYFEDYSIDRGYYSEWELDYKEILDVETDLLYAEPVENGCIMHLSADVYVEADIIHRDEDMSFYDKEEGQYLVEEFAQSNEYHKVTIEVSVKCGLEKDDDGNYCLDGISVCKEPTYRVLYLDEDTMEEWDEVYLGCEN